MRMTTAVVVTAVVVIIIVVVVWQALIVESMFDYVFVSTHCDAVTSNNWAVNHIRWAHSAFDCRHVGSARAEFLVPEVLREFRPVLAWCLVWFGVIICVRDAIFSKAMIEDVVHLILCDAITVGDGTEVRRITDALNLAECCACTLADLVVPLPVDPVGVLSFTPALIIPCEQTVVTKSMVDQVLIVLLCNAAANGERVIQIADWASRPDIGALRLWFKDAGAVFIFEIEVWEWEATVLQLTGLFRAMMLNFFEDGIIHGPGDAVFSKIVVSKEICLLIVQAVTGNVACSKPVGDVEVAVVIAARFRLCDAMAGIPVILVTLWTVVIANVVFIVVRCSQQAVFTTLILKIEESREVCPSHTPWVRIIRKAVEGMEHTGWRCWVIRVLTM